MISDLEARIIAEAPFTPAFQKKVLGSLRKMEKLPQYGIPLDQIPARLDDFDRQWGRGPVRELPSGFKSKSSFQNWRSQVRSALTAFNAELEPVAPAPVKDEWFQLLSELEALNVHPKKLIAVAVLAGLARCDTLSPAQVSCDWLQKMADTADTSGQYEAIKAARALIHKHAESLFTTVSPAFAFPVRKSTAQCVRLELPERLATEVEAWRKNFTEGLRKGHRAKRRSARSDERANAVLQGVGYVHKALVTAGLLSPDTSYSVADMINPDLLAEIIEREMAGEFPWKRLKPSTHFEYLNNWRHFVRGCGFDAEPLAEVVRDFSEFQNVKSMSPARRNWCEEFLNDHRKQAAFFALPNTLFRNAKTAMQNYNSGSEYDRDAAIALGLAACAAAIWTSLPLRISTLLQLTYGSERADVQLNSGRGHLVLTTPPSIVKNGYSHRYISLTPKSGGDPKVIVSWFVREIRPLLLASHISPHLRKPDQLFCGVNYSRMSSIWKNATLDAGVPMTPHQVRHALATVMANQPRADYAIIAALLGDTESTVRKNYVFVDQARKHEEGQKLLAQIQGNVLMRGARNG
mgnify:CR=1 FL=1